MVYRDEILELFQRAATDREHGAVEIERTLIRGLLDIEARWRLESLHRGLKMLAEGQPAMANLRAMAAWMAAIESPASCVSRLARREAVLDELPGRLAANAWPFVENSTDGGDDFPVVRGGRSDGGAWERGWDGSVVVLRRNGVGPWCRPGAPPGSLRSSCFEARCGCAGVAGAGSVVVLVGADAVGRRRFVNSAGTGNLLALARANGRWRAVLVADTGKDVGEEMVDEIVSLSPLHRESPDREWPIFEAVPLDLVTARVTSESAGSLAVFRPLT